MAVEWTDVVAAVGGAIGTIGGVVGVVYGAIYGRRNAGSTQRAALAAEGAAAEAKRSADAATDAARLERDRWAQQVERRHQELRPRLTAVATHLVTDPAGGRQLFGTFTLQRSYRVELRSRTPGGAQSGEVFLLVKAYQQCRFFIEQWPADRHEVEHSEVELRLWPPHPSDEVEQWDCGCDRPATRDRGKDGHWIVQLPVVPPSDAPFAGT